jgi:hypothetical protein
MKIKHVRDPVFGAQDRVRYVCHVMSAVCGQSAHVKAS